MFVYVCVFKRTDVCWICSPGVCPSDSRESAWSGVRCKTGPGVVCGILWTSTRTRPAACTCRYHRPPMVIAVVCVCALYDRFIDGRACVCVRWNFRIRSTKCNGNITVERDRNIVSGCKKTNSRRCAMKPNTLQTGNRFLSKTRTCSHHYRQQKYVFLTIPEPITVWGWATFQTL